MSDGEAGIPCEWEAVSINIFEARLPDVAVGRRQLDFPGLFDFGDSLEFFDLGNLILVALDDDLVEKRLMMKGRELLLPAAARTRVPAAIARFPASS